MTTPKVYKGDTGTIIVLDCGQNITAATARSIEARKPDGTAVSLVAVASGTNSIAYTTLAGTLDQAGTWLLQALVTLPTGTWRGATARLTVHEPFA
jgi:hypothetical protein